MRVLIVDDHAMFRQGLRAMLETIDNLRVAGEAEDGESAVKMAASLKPDLILMDITMPGMDGLEATSRIKKEHPDARILVISMHADHAFVRQALQAGAAGFIYKGGPFDELKNALDTITNGNPYISPRLMGPVINDYITLIPSRQAQELSEELTAREKEILEMVAGGKGRQEIAAELFISPKTVDRHKSNLKEKLNLKSDVEMIDIAKALKQRQLI